MALKTRKLDLVREPVLTAYRNGVSLEEIAKCHNVSKGTVRNLLKSEPGFELRKQGRPKSTTRSNDPVFVKETE